MAVAVDKDYVYKISRMVNNGTSITEVQLGNLPNVTSEFNYSQTLATAGAQLQITVGVTADTANLPVEDILDELGNPITTEEGATLTTERVADIVGDTNSNNLVRNDNLVEVVEYSKYNPNGKTVFVGYIAKWKVAFGNDDNVVITVISLGQDLSNYIVEAGDTEYITQNAQTGTGYSIKNYDKSGFQDYAAQTFTMPLTKTVDAATVMVTTTMSCTVAVYVRRMTGSTPDPFSDPVQCYGTANVSGAQTQYALKVTFVTAASLATGFTYYLQVSSNDTGAAYAIASNANPYANGQVYTYQWLGTSYGSSTGYSGSDLYFIIWQYGGATTATYTSKDPSYILNDIITEYNARGGDVIKPPSPVTPLMGSFASGTILPNSYWSNGYAQVFQPVSNMVVNIIQLTGNVTSNSGTITVDIWQGNPANDTITVTGGNGTYDNVGGATLIASSNPLTITNTTEQILSLTLNTPVTLLAGTTYYLRMFFNQAEYGYLVLKTAGAGDLPITGAGVGLLYTARATINNASFDMDYSTANPALYFGLGYYTPITDNLGAGYADTDVTTTYTFKVQTVLEAISTIASLSPYNWYWYVDPSNNVLYFQATATTAQHTMVKGRHIQSLEIEATKERIANVVYFTGGPTAGVNTFKKTTDTESLEDNRVGLARLSDNRVTTDANATIISQGYIDANSAETYLTQITVYETDYDISLFKLGQTIGFANFGTFVDRLLMQIVGIQRSVDQITLSLGVLPRRTTKKIEEIEQGLQAEQTLLNPATPT